MVGPRIRRSIDSSVLVAAAFRAFCVCAAAKGASAQDHASSSVIFGSLDAAPSAFATAGVKVGLNRIDREGLAVLLSGGGGFRSERLSFGGSRPSPILTRWTGAGAAVVGYQWFRDWGVMALFAGPESAIEALSGGGVLRTLPTRLGLRLHAELWARPSAETLLTGTAIAGSARGDLWARLSYGVRIRGTYFGPEAAVYTDGTGYEKWSVGLHATDLPLGDIRLRLSAGYLTETKW